MFDTEKLIVEVEQRPCLWNLSEKSYSDKFLKQKAWQEVAENCFEEWNNLRNEDKEKKSEYFYQIFINILLIYYIYTGCIYMLYPILKLPIRIFFVKYQNTELIRFCQGNAPSQTKIFYFSVQFLQKKWKAVRDYYTREKKKKMKKEVVAQQRRRKYARILIYCTSPENTDNDDSNITGNNDDEALDEQFRSTEADSPLYQPSTSQPASMQTPEYQNQPSTSKQTPTVSSQPSVSRTKNKKQTMTLFQESLLKKLDNDDKDPNRYFLLSFLPEMSKMTEKQNFEFRMEVMKALNKVKYQIPE
ncbi:uncharacterized protein [Epargyreus clarus]|uniref:uncharacterized protein n=1 Tax=Epargyreus clarus TaxID=520877 RepID=UPI003C2D4C26